MGWILVGVAFAVACAISGWMANRWGHGAHTGMSVDLETQAHNRPPKTLI